MHNFFREKLNDAYGESKFVIVINVDVREFSKFSKRVDSAESALFIKRIFLRLLTEYFSDASFLKSTGDGLIIIYDVTQATYEVTNEALANVTNLIADKALQLVKNFKDLCALDPAINFSVPLRCGVGISRGPATCLRTANSILDYFGDTLNVASRLMDCARPEGVIFDSKFSFELLNEDTKSLFETSSIYLKGVSENHPIDVWYTKENTQLSPSLFLPISESPWETVTETKKFKELKELGGKYFMLLEHKTLDKNQITLEITHGAMKSSGVPHKGYVTIFEFKGISYAEKAGQFKVTIDFDQLIVKLNKNKVMDNMDITMELKSPIG